MLQIYGNQDLPIPSRARGRPSPTPTRNKNLHRKSHLDWGGWESQRVPVSCQEPWSLKPEMPTGCRIPDLKVGSEVTHLSDSVDARMRACSSVHLASAAVPSLASCTHSVPTGHASQQASSAMPHSQPILGLASPGLPGSSGFLALGSSLILTQHPDQK